MKGRPKVKGRPQAVRRLRKILALLATTGQKLQKLHASLPVSPQEDEMLAGEEAPDFSFKARTTIECVQNDHLEAVIAALQALLDPQEG